MGSASYSCDANGNMTTRGSQSIALDVEDRPTSVSQGGSTVESYVYDGDGKRLKKVAWSEATVRPATIPSSVQQAISPHR